MHQCVRDVIIFFFSKRTTTCQCIKSMQLQHNYNQPKREIIATRASNNLKEHFTIRMISFKFDCVVILSSSRLNAIFLRGISG